MVNNMYLNQDKKEGSPEQKVDKEDKNKHNKSHYLIDDSYNLNMSGKFLYTDIRG